jgi:Na+/alanine symporter
MITIINILVLLYVLKVIREEYKDYIDNKKY